MKYLIVGSFTIDIIDNNLRCGGSALYCPIPLIILGASFDIYGTVGRDLPWDVPYYDDFILLDETISFKHHYRSNGSRDLWILKKPKEKIKIEVEDEYDAVLINPLIDEFDHDSIRKLLKRIEYSAVDMQGFLRLPDKDGLIRFRKPDKRIGEILNTATIVTASHEEYFWSDRYGKIFVLTRGDRGVRVFIDSKPMDIPTVKVFKAPVGSGDMFIASLLYFYTTKEDLLESLIHANALTSALIELLPVRDHCLPKDEVRSVRREVLKLYKERVAKIKETLNR